MVEPPSIPPHCFFFLGFPQPPVVEWFGQNSTFCFGAPAPPIIPEHYEVNLMDKTGSLTRLNYDTTSCLLIVSDLFPYQCGPFHLSVTAINTMGRETTSFNATATACDCSQQTGVCIVAVDNNLRMSVHYDTQ